MSKVLKAFCTWVLIFLYSSNRKNVLGVKVVRLVYLHLRACANSGSNHLLRTDLPMFYTALETPSMSEWVEDHHIFTLLTVK